jgi:hypothetical protein
MLGTGNANLDSPGGSLLLHALEPLHTGSETFNSGLHEDRGRSSWKGERRNAKQSGSTVYYLYHALSNFIPCTSRFSGRC